MDILDLLGGDPPSKGASARGGRKPLAELDGYVVRSLEEADRAALLAPPPVDSKTPVVRELRHGHHQLARTLAEGFSNEEASLITGYSISRVSILQGDPAFAQLVQYYQGRETEATADVVERRRTLGLSAMDELKTRLEDDPESWTKGELMDLVGLTVGKAGNGGMGGGVAPAPAGAQVTQIVFVPPTPREEPPSGKGPVVDMEKE